MVFYLEVNGKLERCKLTDYRDESVLLELKTLSDKKTRDIGEIANIKEIRGYVARKIVESGKYEVIG